MNSTKLDHLKGEEVKKILEQKTPDGEVNTLPEVFEKMKDIPDDMDLEEWVRHIAEESGVDPEEIRQQVEIVLALYADDASDEEVDSWFED